MSQPLEPKRVLPLFIAQSISTGSTTISTVLSSIIMGHLHQPHLVGLPTTLLQFSGALSAGMFGALMLRRGRKLGLGLAFCLGALGALLGFLGGLYSLVPLFLLGAALIGLGQGGYYQTRYALIESVPEERRGSALGFLMLMSVLGSFVVTGLSGPIEHWARLLQTIPELVGWLVAGILLLAAALLMLIWQPWHGPQQRERVQLPLREILIQPGVRSTVLALAVGQGLMATLMTLTPMRAHALGLGHGQVAALISGHILGMYGFGWFTGPLVDRLGLRLGYLGAALLLVSAALTAPLPGQTWLAISMFLLGLGWNLSFVSASKAMARFPAAQGLGDGLSYVLAGGGTLLGGFIIAWAGFPVLAYLCAALALLLGWCASRVR